MKRQWILRLSLVIFLITQTILLVAQQFGRNKPHYKIFDFKVKKSLHFSLHHYLRNDAKAEAFAAASERWYQYEQIIFQDSFPERNPVILYANHADFQQTTAIMGDIGVGTGGVTEGLRNRIAMPVMELNSQTNHVLGHELVHAFQYNLFRNSKDSLKLSDIQNIPLWMVEGLAEYLSIGNVDPHTAMWMRDAVRTNDFPTLKDLTRGYKYFPYRYGQAFWAYVAGVFGDTAVHSLFLNTAKLGYEDAIMKLTGLKEKAFSEVWKKNFTDYYGKFKSTLKEDNLAGKLIIGRKQAGDMNIAPVLSPDGQYLTFLSQKNFFSIDLFLADARTGKILKTLSSTARESHIDDFSFIESAGTWSPLSDRFAFVVFSKGRSMLTVVDVGASNKTNTFPIPGVPSFSNPSWSPNGENIIVSGMVDGQGDLYLYNLKTNAVTQLTNDWYSDIQPQWSRDGRFILFVSDRPANGRSYKSKLLQVCLLDRDSNEITILDLFHGAENLNPIFSIDNQSIYFLSNRDGFRNLYTVEISTGNIHQLTDYFTGISGITAYSPAISMSAKTGNVCYTYYADRKYSIYIAKPDEFNSILVSSQEVDFSAGTLPPQDRPMDIVNSALKKVEYIPGARVKAPSTTYKPKLALEYIGNEAGIGVTTGSFGTRTGMAGAVNMMFGDMLGYQKIFSSLSLNGEIYDFGGQFAYLNQRNKINWGVSLSHTPYRSARMSIAPDTVIVESDTLLTDHITLDVFRLFQESANLFSYWILSTTQRLEAGLGYSSYSMRIDRYDYQYFGNYRLREDRTKLDAPEGYKLGNAYAAYVFDNSYFGLASPLRGKRYRVEIEKTYDALDYHTIMLDYRHYAFINPTAIAFRMLHIGRHGKDSESELIYPLSFAYPTLTRGNSLDNIQGYSDEETGAYSINQIFGSRILVINIEWRIPFTGPERLSLIKSDIFFTELAFFGDAGIAWNSSTVPTLKHKAESVEDRIPFLSAGLSLRINLFGAMVLEPYYAFPWRGDRFEKGVFGLNFTPGW